MVHPNGKVIVDNVVASGTTVGNMDEKVIEQDIKDNNIEVSINREVIVHFYYAKGTVEVDYVQASPINEENIDADPVIDAA